jgi:large subunit ribosomal protein L18
MARLGQKAQQATSRKRRVRNIIRGTAERPRLMLKVSNRGLEAQIINDQTGETIVGAREMSGKSLDHATKFGKSFASLATKQKIDTVVFDRGSKQFHGRVKAFVEAAREAGLEF